MHILNITSFWSQMTQKGFRSIADLAKHLHIHRNTIHHYLSGNPVFPEKLQALIDVLELDPKTAIIETRPSLDLMLEPVATPIDQFHLRNPSVTLILFGSRARGSANKYSDWDLGAYQSQGINQQDFRQMKQSLSDLADQSVYFFDLVNLTQADPEFLKRIATHWKFVTGPRTGWVELQKKVFA